MSNLIILLKSNLYLWDFIYLKHFLHSTAFHYQLEKNIKIDKFYHIVFNKYTNVCMLFFIKPTKIEIYLYLKTAPFRQVLNKNVPPLPQI